MLRQAVLAGAGIALPTYYVVEDLQRGVLVRLSPDHEPLGIHAVYLSRQHQPRALRQLIEFLAERFAGGSALWDRRQHGGTDLPNKRRQRPVQARK